MTENHNLNTPEKGAADWHIPLNENFKTLDTDVPIQDEEANRSQYTPKEGAKFEATDTGAEFIGDGSSWNRIASTGPDPMFNSWSLEGPNGGQVKRELLGTFKNQGDEVFQYEISGADNFDWVTIYLSIDDGWRNTTKVTAGPISYEGRNVSGYVIARASMFAQGAGSIVDGSVQEGEVTSSGGIQDTIEISVLPDDMSAITGIGAALGMRIKD